MNVGERKIGAKFVGFRGWTWWRSWGKARSTCNTSNPWIKINKTSSNQQITKKIGMALFVGIFEIGQKHTKLGLESGEEELQSVNQRGSDPR
jgi:hypothetical protein